MVAGRFARLLVGVFAIPAFLVGVPAIAQDAPLIEGTPAGEWTGERFDGGAGITETVDQIMERGAQLPRGALAFREKKEMYGALDKGPNPLAPAVASWPPGAVAGDGEGVPVLLSRIPLLPQTVGISFLGMQGPGAESPFVPPDSVGDVGPTQVLMASNGRIKVFSKTGALGPLNTTMDNFFAAVGGLANGTSDPHIRYDRLSQRWFVVIIDLAGCPNNVLLAVSSGPTINGTSSFTFFSFQGQADFFTDYPTLGVDASALYISGNMFDSTQVGCPAPSSVNTTVWVVDKSDLIGGTLTLTAFRNLVAGGVGLWTPQGVDNDDPQATLGFFVGVDFNLFSRIGVYRVANPGGPTPTLSLFNITVPTTVFPIAQPQPAGPALDALDDRTFAGAIHRDKITNAVSLWTAHNIQVNSSGVGSNTGGRNGSRWYQIGNLTTTPALLQAGTLFDAAATTPFGYWIPSVAMTGQGHVALAASRASASGANGGFGSVAAAGRLRTDALGTTQAPTLGQPSTFNYDTFVAGTERWGDYSQTVVDPNDDQTVWTFQEYVSATNTWGVRAVQLVAPPPATPASANPASVPSGQPSVSVVITGTSSAGSEFFDPGPDTGGPGFLNRIGAAISGGVTVNSVTFTAPGQVTLNVSTVGTPAGAKNVTVTNPDGQARTGNGILTVTGCSTITVNPPSIAGGTRGTPYSQTFTQTGGSPPATFGLSGILPTGMTFDTGTATLSGTPTQVGSFNFTVTATDAGGCTGSRGYTLDIGCNAITVNPSSIAGGTLGTPYSQTFTQAGGVGAIGWSVSGTLPAGLGLDPSTGILSGTPTQIGSFSFTVTATDAAGCTGGRDYTLDVGCQAITVGPTTIATGTAGSSYSQTFNQTGGVGAIGWSVAGTLPAGLGLDPSTGVLSGTPTQIGSFPITVTATDANGCVGSRDYTLVVGCQVLTVDPPTIPAGTVGTPYNQTFTQTGGIGGVTWSLSGILPAGIGFEPATGVLFGVPNEIGSFPITVTATDSNGCVGSRDYTLVIDRAGPFVATALAVDTAGSRVFEPGETVVVAPSWRNDTGAAEALTGAAGSFTGPGSAVYTITDPDAVYGMVAPGDTATCSAGSGGDCYGLSVSVPNPRPAVHWDSTFVETLSSTDTKTWTLHIGESFTDVAVGNGFYRFIETILHNNVTGGCTATEYCPTASTTREAMAVFVLVSSDPGGTPPPLCVAGSEVFDDVPAASGFCRWIEELFRRGVVTGCAADLYCPASAATREQMAVFVLRTLDPNLQPPACVAGDEVFDDVPASSGFCRWIEELVRRGVVTGCGGPNYCPSAFVTREQMSVFLAATFGLALYGL